MESLSVGKVVLATFPFSDLKSKKVRPGLIIGLAEFNDIILCQITSQQYRGKMALNLKNGDFKQGSIAVDSFIRPDKIVTLDRSRISRILGLVAEDKLLEVKRKLTEIFELH